MTTKNNTKFSARAFTSSVITLSFIATVLSSFVLFIVPNHYIVEWFGWTFLGADPDIWEALHVVFGLIFMLFGLYHSALNWKVLVSYFKNKGDKKRGIRKESLYAIILSVVVTVGCIAEIPPFSTIMEFPEPIRDSFDQAERRPAYAHTEELPLHVFAKIIDKDPQGVIQKLQDAGFSDVRPTDTLEALGEKYDRIPLDFYEIINTP